MGWANSSAGPSASTSAARSPSASRAAGTLSRLASAAVSWSGAGPPRTASARVSRPASSPSRATGRSTARAAGSRPMLSTRASASPSPAARSVAASDSSRNGFPPVLAWPARHSSGLALLPSRSRRNRAVVSRSSGSSHSSVPAGQVRSSPIKDGSPGPVRVASSSATGRLSIRVARCTSQRSDGASAHCASSTAITSGRRAARFATSQYRPCIAAYRTSSSTGPASVQSNTRAASPAAPSSSPSHSPGPAAARTGSMS